MKIRRDILTVSSLLFTLALLIPMPDMLRLAWTFNRSFLHRAGHPWFEGYSAEIGFAGMSTITVALIVTWKGYIKGVRWAWLAMFAVVWLWAFPVFLLPYLPEKKHAVPITHLFPVGMKESGVAGDLVETVLAFQLMVLALVLPIKKFFRSQAGGHARIAGASSKGS